jgi:Zn ribbon nucleic-acid-binding protein
MAKVCVACGFAPQPKAEGEQPTASEAENCPECGGEDTVQEQKEESEE